MQEIFNEAISSFIANNMEGIRRFSGWFAKLITVNIMNEDNTALKELCKYSVDMRSDIEFTEPIKYNKDFYLGYCVAYENIARRLLDEDINLEKIDLIVNGNPSLRLDKIIYFLGHKGYAKQNEIATYLEISPSHLWNILNNSNVKEIDIFTVQKIGKYTIYGLNQRGKQYFTEKTSKEIKQFSKRDIIEIISYMVNKHLNIDVDHTNIKEPSLLDKNLIDELDNKFYELLITNEILNSRLYEYINYHSTSPWDHYEKSRSGPYRGQANNNALQIIA
ncbi:MAG: hypothetical protein GX288_12315 [Clostridiales bacterium]|nr:hypothetical protein [Clostridiales bacterium]